MVREGLPLLTVRTLLVQHPKHFRSQPRVTTEHLLREIPMIRGPAPKKHDGASAIVLALHPPCRLLAEFHQGRHHVGGLGGTVAVLRADELVTPHGETVSLRLAVHVSTSAGNETIAPKRLQLLGQGTIFEM